MQWYWYIPALLASLLWAVVVIVDKFVLTHHIRDAYSYQLIQTVTFIPPALFLFFCYSSHESLLLPITIFVLGLIFGLAFILYNRALLVEEVSRVTPLFYLIPLFVIILSALFLGEHLPSKSYIGIGLMVLSAILVSFRWINIKSLAFSISPALFMMLFLDLLMAGKDIIAKFMFSYIDYWTYLFWFVLGNIAIRPFLLLHPGIKIRFIADMKSLKPNIYLLCFINSALAWTGFTLYFYSVSMTYVSLVSAIPSTQPFFVFLFAIVLGVFYPELIKENIDEKSAVVIKGIAAVMVLVGTYLIVA
ncbi:MAG: EamA family transporter [Euryarchaeota archaeon]|nr:EamA family transporter [Euryarchaeota archaeon]